MKLIFCLEQLIPKFILLLILLSGCQQQPTTNIKIDSSFHTNQITQIKAAVSFWKENLNITTSLNDFPEQPLSKPNTIYIFNANKGWKNNKFKKLTKNRETPIATTINKQIFIPPSHYPLYKIVAHELGHTFGCYHTNNESDIMFPFLSTKQQSISKNCSSLIRKTF